MSVHEGSVRDALLADDQRAEASERCPTRIYCSMFQAGAFPEAVPNEDIRYFNGIGVTDDTVGYLLNGAFGLTVEEHIVRTYQFIASRYNAHVAHNRSSEVWLFGLSRGAYTVRAVAAMIHNFGILKDPTDKNCRAIFELYINPEEQYKPGSAFVRSLKSEMSYTNCKHEKPIRFMGLFDTVGALGIPKIVNGDHFGYNLYDTVVGDSVQYVCQATSIHDRLSVFQPCSISRETASLPQQMPGRPAPEDQPDIPNNIQDAVPTIEECLLPGCHYDLGRQEFVPWRKGQGRILDGLTGALDFTLDGVDYLIGRPGVRAATRVKPDHSFADHALNYILNRACQIGLDPDKIEKYFRENPRIASPRRSLISRLPNPFWRSNSNENPSYGTGDVYDIVPVPSFLTERALPIRSPQQADGLVCYGNVVELKETYSNKDGHTVDLVKHLSEVPWKYKSRALEKYHAVIRNIEEYHDDDVRYANFKKMIRRGKVYDYKYKNFKTS